MGAVNSCWTPHRREFSENHVSTPKEKGHRRNLSAAFNLSLMAQDMDASCNLLNINTATEEELMTLPGINRHTAQNIVEYRRRILGFKKVEDLALVSGVGATKLSQIRDEITVSSKKSSSSRGSSVENSNLDLSPSEREVRRTAAGNPPKLVNVNTANVFQLMKVKGIGQAIAENIVSYRDKKGPFKSLDDLDKVKRIGPALLGSVRYQLTLTEPTGASPNSPEAPSPYANGDVSNNLPAFNVHGTGDANANCIHHTAELNKDTLNLTASQNDLFDILGPLARRPSRPDVKPYTFKHQSRRCLRLASWNLQQCGVDKASNPGVRDVICMTILENGFSVVAFQELADKDALQKICDELNYPVLPNVKRWSGHRGSWDCVTSEPAGRMFRSTEYNGFLYDKSQKVSLLSSALLDGKDNGRRAFTRKPFVGVFKLGRVDCVLVSVHLKATGLQNEDRDRLGQEVDRVSDVIHSLNIHFPGEHDVVIMGDFNLTPGADDFVELKEKGYKNCIPADTYTNISTSRPEGSKSYDNIWVANQTKSVLTGEGGVIRDGLHSPWIPDGWKWGGVVSDHCPVWTELYSSQDLDRGDLSAGADKITFFTGDD
ncbi:endonuclease/exonuclease/phosphatase family domain-containing protein 1-like [Liolophura sinensis]|uniref:endonuclease/exonuclease/phosphatase family domain-containing protein 1-like n=1 Tax=Liolophura sinensis TaxID=3198878 RepID=UPI003159417B